MGCSDFPPRSDLSDGSDGSDVSDFPAAPGGGASVAADLACLSKPVSISLRLRYLLARRLARLQRFQEARPYYPETWQPRLEAYAEALQTAGDQGQPQGLRAKAWWKAACMARYQGMELLGTELEPDWFLYDGQYDRPPYALGRKGCVSLSIAPSADGELKRAGADPSHPDIRFHYKKIAVAHAGQALTLMPDESMETAKVLCITASWMTRGGYGDMNALYKELVRRCGSTSIGQEAEELGWFPKIEIDVEELLGS